MYVSPTKFNLVLTKKNWKWEGLKKNDSFEYENLSLVRKKLGLICDWLCVYMRGQWHVAKAHCLPIPNIDMFWKWANK